MIPVHRYLFAVISIAVVAGCATTSGSSHNAGDALFLLQQRADTGTPQTAPAQPQQPTLVVAQIEVAPYLARGGIVYQTAPNRIVIADNNRWAAPLVAQLRQGLYHTLEQRLTQISVRQPGLAQQPDYRLSVNLQHFQGRYDGNASISGSWHMLNQQDQIIARGDFKQLTPLQQDGYPALVDALSRGWHTVKAQLAQAIGDALARMHTGADARAGNG